MGGTVLVSALTAKTVQAVPAALETSVVKAAMGAITSAAALPELASETLKAWQWARIKLAVGLATASVALVLITLGGSGLFARHALPQPAAVRDAPSSNTSTSEQLANSSYRPAVNVTAEPSARIGALTGLVLDSNDRPVAGAKVWGGFCYKPFAEDTSGSSGEFALAAIAAPALVTVAADGFGADQQSFDPSNALPRLVFRLQPIEPVAVQLVDTTGHGVEGVKAFLQEWWGRAGTLGQYLEGLTDSEGRLRWTSPPRGEFQLTFHKTGYRHSRTNKMVADGKEHVIVLYPIATVTGRVTDAETGAPVPAFRFTMGHAQPWIPSDPTPMWDRQSREGSNGFYKVVIEEEQTPYLQIEADGYVTMQSELRLANATEGVCDFQLKPLTAGNSIRGTVLMPDGSPAAGVEVALCTESAGVMLNGIAFEPGLFGNIKATQSDYRKKTDEQGLFSFAPKPGAHTVVAVSSAGLGQTRCFDFSNPLEIRLQPWGRIEGQVRTRDGNWVDRKVSWSRTGNLTRWMTLFYEPRTAMSDSSGGFTIEQVPPGDCRVAVGSDIGARVFSSSIHVNPGETVQVQVGGVGRQVTGKFVAPLGVDIRSWSNQTSVHLHIEWADYNLPKDLSPGAAERWKLEFEDTETGQAWFRDQCAYYFKVEEDGSFTLPEVLPGKYRLFVNVGQGDLGSGPNSKPRNPGDPQIASAAPLITVTEEESPLNLGEILLNASR